MKTTLLKIALFSSALLPMSAATISYSGSVGGNAVDVTANYTFGNNTLTVGVANNLVNQTSVAEAISAIDFTISGGLNATLTSATGTLINVASDGSVTSLGSSTLDWNQPNAGSNLTTALGSSGPDQTILGPTASNGKYTNANGSIAGNGPHNPFVSQTATLTYSVAGATANTQLSNFTFYFNTTLTPSNSITVTPQGTPGVPEPSSMALLGSGAGLFGLFTALRRRNMKPAVN